MLSDFCREFNGTDRDYCCRELLESQHRPDPLFHAAMITGEVRPAQENWFGVTPDGTPLALRGITLEEIYRLDCVTPLL